MKTSANTIKFALAVVGIAVFGYAMRIQSNALRWVGIVLVATAFALRFVTPRS